MDKNKTANVSLKDGYIYDFATNKPVDFRKPEEKVRQEYEKILYDDYFYNKEQLDIEVPIQLGSTLKKSRYSYIQGRFYYKRSISRYLRCC